MTGIDLHHAAHVHLSYLEIYVAPLKNLSIFLLIMKTKNGFICGWMMLQFIAKTKQFNCTWFSHLNVTVDANPEQGHPKFLLVALY